MTNYFIGAGIAWLIGGILCLVEREFREAVLKVFWTILCGPFFIVAAVIIWCWQWVPGRKRISWFRGRKLSTEALNRFASNVRCRTYPDGAWVVTWRRGAFLVLRAPAPPVSDVTPATKETDQ